MTGRTYKQLNIDDRKIIENDLNTPNIKLKIVASHLNRDPKCIRYEVSKRRVLKVRSNQRNKCGLQKICDKTRLCPDCISGKCKFCTHDSCNQICSSFIGEPVCPRIARWPYVCNGCKELSECKLPKYFYYADAAERNHLHAVSDWKEGPRLNDKDMSRVIKAFQEDIPKKIGIDVIIKTHDLPISVATGYRYIDNHDIPNIMNGDLKRKTRYKTRNGSTTKIVHNNPDWLEGRRFNDYVEMILENPSINVWQMDTIIGKRGKEEKCVLSLLYTKTNLQLFFLLDKCDSIHVNRLFDYIKTQLGDELFKEIFPVILTDNGSEFHEPLQIETSFITGEKLINIYYCEPRRCDQKGKCEKNHEHFRELVPKGVSMNPLSKHDINYVSNMVNNYPRKSLGYKTPYELSLLFLNEKVLGLNNLKALPINQVKLTPIIK